MNTRLKHIYMLVGRVLNHPTAFGLEERPPKALQRALTTIQCELMKELQEEISEVDFLAAELSQDSDNSAPACATSNSFTLQKTGT